MPDGFRFAPKLALRRLDRLTVSLERLAALGDRLGPVRLLIESPRDDGLLAFVLGSLDPSVELAWDLRDASWDGVDGIVRVNDVAAEPFRYIRLREPPYSDSELGETASQLRAPAYVYLRHEDEPTAPAYAARLRELLTASPPPPA